jgi:UPF0716 family protein affecting phage T7 exclusion
MAKKKKGADGEDVHEGGFCWCTRDLTAIFIFAVGGLTLLIPGFMLRLENVLYFVCPIFVTFNFLQE